MCDQKIFRIRKFNFCKLTFLATQETREAKGFATGVAKGYIYCSIIIYPFQTIKP